MIYNMDELYEIVGQELKRGEESPGLMARAIAETEGDPHKAKSIYIRYRIEQLKANAKSAALRNQGTEGEAFLAEYKEFPFFLSVMRKIVSQQDGLRSDEWLKRLRDNVPTLFYKTAHHLHYSKRDVKEAARYYGMLIERFPLTQEAAWCKQELERIDNGHGQNDVRPARTTIDKDRGGKWYEESGSALSEGILELRDPIEVRADSRSGTKKDPELFSVTEGISNDELRLFLGRRSAKYLRRFRSFKKGKRVKFSITWHWPAFLVGFWWMFYRRLYLWGFLEFALTLIPGLWLLSRPVFAMTANYLMYKRAARTIVSLKSRNSSKDVRWLKEAIQRSGGTDSWIPYLAIPLAIIHFVMVAGISILALFTPKILKYFW